MRCWVVILLLFVNLGFGQGVVGVWHDPSLPHQTGHADPHRLLTLLKRHQIPVRRLSLDDLANPQVLNPERIAVVLLPYGAFFPDEAIDNFRRYLKAGGRFVSLGGYAFDEIYPSNSVPSDKNLRWEKVAHQSVRVSASSHRVQVAVPANAPVDFHRARAVVSLRLESTYMLTGKIRTKGIVDGHGAYFAVEYYDGQGNRIAFQQTQPVQRTEGWQEVGVFLRVPKGTEQATLSCIVHGRGEAEFANWRLQRIVNTRWGEARDWLHIHPDQIAVFDPSFRIDGATTLEIMGSQQTVKRGNPSPSRWTLEEPLKGYAAVALVGENNPVFPKSWAQFVPVLIARDRYGRYLGPAFSVLRHFAGPYAGSSWAFCGVESHDLTESPAFQTVLVSVLRHLLWGVYLHSLQPSLWCYRKGETATFSVKVRNSGVAPQTVTVRLRLFPMPKLLQMDKAIFVGERTVSLSPGEQQTITMQWRVPNDATALYALQASLGMCEAHPCLLPSLHEVWSGVCVWDEEVLHQATPIAWKSNALCEWDEEEKVWKPRFWFGTNQTGVMFSPEATWENPLQWEWEFALMRQMGLRVLRVLHISPFAGDLEKPSETFWRRYDALVLMSHRHGLVLMPTLHEWMNVSLDDETLRKQGAFVRQVGARYREAPRIVWDIENEAWVDFRDHPDLHRLFNEWLRERYGSDERLQAAWKDKVRLGEVRYTRYEPRSWDDLRFWDLQHFRRWLVARWVRANVQALRESGAQQPVTDEIDWKVVGDHYEAAQWLTFTNLHYYGDRNPAAIATYLKFHERLLRGHGLSVGEFGARDHPSFRFGGWGYATTDEVIRHFVNLPLLTLALGGAIVLNWDWKDMESCIFPWGLVHQHGIYAKRQGNLWQVEAALKASGKTFAALARFFKRTQWDREFPSFWTGGRSMLVVLPDEHLLGAEGEVRWSGLGPAGRISAAVFRSLEALMRLKVSFSVVREWELKETLAQRPTLVIFPIPFVWRDETFAAVQQFVADGGVVLITGDFTFDLDRQRTKTERLKTLLGADFVDGLLSPLALEHQPAVRCIAVDDHFALTEWQGKPCVRVKRRGREHVLAMTEKGDPVVVAQKVGKGLVIFSADAPELRSVDETVRLYKALLLSALQLAGTKPETINRLRSQWLTFGKEADLLTFMTANGSGGWFFVVANPARYFTQAHLETEWGDCSRLNVPPYSSAFLKTGPHSEAEAALLARDFWGIGLGYKVKLLVTSAPYLFLWGESWIGTAPMGFIPLQLGSLQLRVEQPTVTVTVRDLVTGKVLQREQVKVVSGVLTLHVPPELVLSEWQIEDANTKPMRQR